MTIRHTFLMLILSVICTVSAIANDKFYVDNEAKGANNGSSWKDAWTSISSINWNNIKPGATIYISGGKEQKLYQERLIIQASGAKDNYITITNGIEPEHSGRATIDLSTQEKNRGGRGIYGGEKNYFIVKNLAIINGMGEYRNPMAFFTRCNDFVLDGLYIEFEENVGIRINGASNKKGIEYGSENVIIKNCVVFEKQNSNDSANDAVVVQNTKKFKIHDCKITNHNDHPNPHTDNIQIFGGEDFYLYNNYLVTLTACDINHHNLMIERCRGVNYIYNNVLYNNQTGSGMAFVGNRNSGKKGIYKIYNNTAVGFGVDVWNLWDADNAEFKNNICYNGSTSNKATIFSLSDTEGAKWENNIYVCTKKDLAGWSKPSKQLMDNDTGSMRVDPKFVDLEKQNLRLSADSPAIGKGVVLKDFDYDIDYKKRSSSSWDIGAYVK